MPELPELKESLQNTILESYQEEFKELTTNWTGLEGKAQNIVTIAGIFIAGVFAYIRETKANNLDYEKGFLIFSMFCLIGSIVWAIRALYIQKVMKSPFGKNTDDLATALSEVSAQDEFEERLRRFMKDQIKSWRDVRDNIADKNEEKAKHILFANIFLISAILSVAILSIFKLLFLINYK